MFTRSFLNDLCGVRGLRRIDWTQMKLFFCHLFCSFKKLRCHDSIFFYFFTVQWFLQASRLCRKSLIYLHRNTNHQNPVKTPNVQLILNQFINTYFSSLLPPYILNICQPAEQPVVQSLLYNIQVCFQHIHITWNHFWERFSFSNCTLQFVIFILVDFWYKTSLLSCSWSKPV